MAVKLRFRKDAEDWLAGFTGGERLRTGLLDIRLRKILKQKSEDMDIAEVERLSKQLLYRIEVRAIATIILLQAGVPLPYGLQCHEWSDESETRFMVGLNTSPPVMSNLDVWRSIHRSKCLLKPTPEQGEAWLDVPANYIKAGLMLADFTLGELQEKLKLIKQQADARLKRLAKVVKNDKDCKASGSAFIDTLKRGMRDGQTPRIRIYQH
jgi:hypothetical protein